MQLTSGTLLHGGTYRIERTLGQGSFGITYLATHTSLERKVAIKEFFMKELNSRGNDGSITGMSDGSLSYNYGQKFKKEALNLSRLDHPNIVRVTDSFDENGTYYYVMDYIEGENLNDYLKHTAVSQKDAIDIITAVAKALQYMHDTKHMLHLDLKPGNIMRRASDGHIFLIDFGLSKHFSNSGQPETSTTIGLGTPGYAPIEQSNQAKNGEFRPTIDVYALGATLFKLLTRETPPPASDIVSDDELIEDKLRANGITGNIIDVVVNAMLPNVKKRTQSVGAFIWALTANKTTATSTATTSKANVQNEETIIADASTSKGEETIITPSTIKHPDFDESKYVIPTEFKNYPTTTGSKANSGDVEAMLALGMMALRGEGVQQDTDTAYAWFQKLKNLGDDRGEMLMNHWYKLKEKYKKTENAPLQQKTSVINTTRDEQHKSGGNPWVWIVAILIAAVGVLVWNNSSSTDTSSSFSATSDDQTQCMSYIESAEGEMNQALYNLSRAHSSLTNSLNGGNNYHVSSEALNNLSEAKQQYIRAKQKYEKAKRISDSNSRIALSESLQKVINRAKVGYEYANDCYYTFHLQTSLKSTGFGSMITESSMLRTIGEYIDGCNAKSLSFSW